MRSTFAAILALATLSGAAQAAEFKVTIIPHSRAELISAARAVCRQATATDVDGEFGTLSDCVADSLALATVSPAAIQSAAR